MSPSSTPVSHRLGLSDSHPWVSLLGLIQGVDNSWKLGSLWFTIRTPTIRYSQRRRKGLNFCRTLRATLSSDLERNEK